MLVMIRFTTPSKLPRWTIQQDASNFLLLESAERNVVGVVMREVLAPPTLNAHLKPPIRNINLARLHFHIARIDDVVGLGVLAASLLGSSLFGNLQRDVFDVTFLVSATTISNLPCLESSDCGLVQDEAMDASLIFLMHSKTRNCGSFKMSSDDLDCIHEKNWYMG